MHRCTSARLPLPHVCTSRECIPGLCVSRAAFSLWSMSSFSLFLPSLSRNPHLSLLHTRTHRAPTSARPPFLFLPLSFSLRLDSRCTEVWILVGLAGASIVASLSAGNIGVDRSSCCWRSHCLVRELFISKVYDSIVCK